MVIPFAPGGTTDLIGRMVAEGLSRALGQPVVVENKAGAGGNLGAADVARAPPGWLHADDGNTGSVGDQSLRHANTPFQADKDFAAVSYVADVPNVILANPATGFRNVEDMLAAARARPGQLNWGSPGVGSTGHIALEMLKQQAKVDIVHVPYKGASQATADLLGGQIQLSGDNVPTALPYIRGGKLVALGVMGDRELPALPGVAPVNATVPGYSLNSWFVVVAPAGTPKPIIDRTSAIIDAYIKQPEVAAKLRDLGAIPVGGPPERLARASEGRAGALSRSHRADEPQARMSAAAEGKARRRVAARFRRGRRRECANRLLHGGRGMSGRPGRPRKRLAVARFWYEGNAFAPLPADIEAFERCEWARGASALAAAHGTATELGAVAAFAQQHPQWEVVTLRCASALPAGPIDETVFERFATELRDGIVAGLADGGWDAVYLSLHGAAITTARQAPDLDLVRLVRGLLPEVPLGASFDLHGNMAPEFAALLDVASVYRTHPHIDMADTAARVLDALMRCADGTLQTRRVLRNEGVLLPSFNMRTERRADARARGSGAQRHHRRGPRGRGVRRLSLCGYRRYRRIGVRRQRCPARSARD